MTHERIVDPEQAPGAAAASAAEAEGGNEAAAQGHAARRRNGRPTSWIAVAVIIAGFTLGGLGLVLGPTWWLFWAGAAVTVAGGIFGLATGIMEDYTTEAH